MDCYKVVQLRLGQTPEQVRALLGEPRFAGAEGGVWSVSGELRTDYMFIYGGAGEVFIGTRDEMYVSFLKNALVEVSSYRMNHFPDKTEGGTGVMLGSRDSGHGPSEPLHELGSAFTQIFHCPSDFPLEKARADFAHQGKP